MRASWIAGAAAAAAMLAGCSLTSGNVSPFASTAQPVVAAPAAPPVIYGAFLEGPVGTRLTQASRDKALAAEQEALASGARRTWKGDNGAFGFVEPAGTAAKPAAAEADGALPPAGAALPACRAFTSTIFLGGRAQVGHGSGCQNPDGSYRITG